MSNAKIKSMLRDYSLAYHYLELHYNFKDEAYDKYLGDIELEYSKFHQKLNSKTSFEHILMGLNIQKMKMLLIM